ncbi:MAG: response regulator [Gammaproteobacteria bacterium]|nr:MAG: response regulator [Gammaproteobacteria bacterium]
MTMRILLIDDHALFRMGLRELLSRRGIEVVDAVGSAREGIAAARALNPDVVLLDLRMPDQDGLEVLKKLREGGVTIPIVMLTTSAEERDVLESLRCGAQGYLLKDMEPDELVAALKDIVAGKKVLAPDLTHVLVEAVAGETPPAREHPFAELTPREQEILALLAEGLSNKMIAKKLGISDGTVKLHVKAILRKLGVHSRVEAAVLAVEQGFRVDA